MNLGDFVLLVFAYNLLALGNGPVMVPLFRRSLVEEQSILTTDQLLYAFAIAQVTPGQANLLVASIGYMLFGIAGGLLATVVINLPGYLMLLLLRGYERFGKIRAVRRFTRGMTTASVGLILAATVEIGRQSLTHVVGWVVFLLTLGLMYFWNCPPLLCLLAASGAGLLLKLWL